MVTAAIGVLSSCVLLPAVAAVHRANRETRTAKLVAEQLKRRGLEVQTGIAHTGVVGFLKGMQQRPIVEKLLVSWTL